MTLDPDESITTATHAKMTSCLGDEYLQEYQAFTDAMALFVPQ